MRRHAAETLPVIRARPPLFDEIDAAFHVAGKPVIFAYGDRIFDPEGAGVTPELQAHEAVHALRQRHDGVEIWWRRYIRDAEFRTSEEMIAHRAEYAAACVRWADRNQRARVLHHIAVRLSSPLYGSLIPYDEARRVIATKSQI